MKLMNREPTDEMMEAGFEHADVYACWQAMYDASPSVKVDMEPVAWMFESRHGIGFGKADNALRPHAVNLYSAEQVAALQAEHEDLLKGVKQIQHVLKDNEEWGLRSDRAVRWALLSVDNLIAKYEGEKHG